MKRGQDELPIRDPGARVTGKLFILTSYQSSTDTSTENASGDRTAELLIDTDVAP